MVEPMTQTPVIRRFIGVKPITYGPESSTGATILILAAETNLGPFDVLITQIAGQELTAALNKHPLTRGSA